MRTRLRAIALLCSVVHGSYLHGQYVTPSDALPPIVEEHEQADMVPSQELAPMPVIADARNHFLQEGHLYWGAELLVLDGSSNPARDNSSIAGSRYKLGWEHQSGLGLRARYFTLDADWTLTNSPEGAEIVGAGPEDFYTYAPHYQGSLLVAREVDNLDLDIYRRFMLGDTELLIGSGLSTVRNLERFQHVFDETPPAGDYSYNFSDDSVQGTGIGLAAELKRPLLVRDSAEVSFLLGGRTSWIPIEVESQSELFTFTLEDDLLLHEASIGLELRKRLQSLTLILRGQYEIQEWDTDLVHNRGFDGVSFTVGLGW